MRTVFIPAKYKGKLSKEFMEKIAEAVSQKRIGMFTTIQFMEQMNDLKVFLEAKGKTVLVGGQVLGCDVNGPLKIEKDVDVFLYLGSGMFHQLNLAVQTEKKIVQANPLTQEISEISRDQVDRFRKAREKNLKKAMSGKVFGILVCTKPGQNNPVLAEKTKQFLENKGKTVYMFLFETIHPDETYNFPQVDVWVNTACYRIGLDDVENYPKPLVNAKDLLEEWGKSS